MGEDKMARPQEKIAEPDYSIRGGGEIRKGLDEIVTVVPPVDAMTPEAAVAMAEPKAQDAKE